MKKVLLLFVLVAVACLVSSTAFCAEKYILDSVVKKYLDGAQSWQPVLKLHAHYLFWILATINLIFTFGYGAVRGYSLGEFFSEFIRLVIVTGFFYWLWMNGNMIGMDIIKSFTKMGAEAAGVSFGKNLTPSLVTNLSYDIIAQVVSQYSEQDWGTWLITLLLGIFLAVIFAFIAVQMMMLQISAYILVYAGLWYLGLGAIAYTRDVVINYLKTILGISVQIMVFFLIIGLGFNTVKGMVEASKTTQQIATTDGYLSATGNTILDLVIIVVYAIILLELVKKVPAMISGVITGAGTGGIASTGGAYDSMRGAVASAAMAASGAGIAAGALAGQGMALSAAFKQSQTNMLAGAGKFAGSGGASALSGGLGGAMNKGLTFASDMMANMAQGKKDVKAEDTKKNTGGGRVAEKIEQRGAAQTAERKEAQAKQQAQASGGGGNMTDPGAAAAASSADASSGNDGGAQDPFEGGGSISSGDGGGGYDASKIGLPDDK